MMKLKSIFVLTTIVMLFIAAAAHAQTIVLKRDFVEKYKNRATIDATFVVDHAHARPNPPKKDGDLHASGRSSEIGLPMVSEVVNAAANSQTTVVRDLQDRQGRDQATSISGAWRIWFEHPSQEPQIQFSSVPPAASTNPDHCFEIHPITMFDGQQILESFQEIRGFTPHDADTAFSSYEKLSVTVSSTKTAITLSSKRAGYNYVQFYADLASKADRLDDGGYVALANVKNDSEGDVLVDNVRLIFVPGTPPAQLLAGVNKRGEMHLLGIPRLNLNAISAFVNASGQGNSLRKLPYEIIIVAVLK